MQFDAVFIDAAIVLPSRIAAAAMAVPTIARISAYSAAEAPDSSFSMLIKVFIVPFPSKLACRVGRQSFASR